MPTQTFYLTLQVSQVSIALLSPLNGSEVQTLPVIPDCNSHLHCQYSPALLISEEAHLETEDSGFFD